jgi:hypothetical protein
MQKQNSPANTLANVRVQLVSADGCDGVNNAVLDPKNCILTWGGNTTWQPCNPTTETEEGTITFTRGGESLDFAITGDNWRWLESKQALDAFIQALYDSRSVVTALCAAEVFISSRLGEEWPFNREDESKGNALALYVYRDILDVTKEVADIKMARQICARALNAAIWSLAEAFDSFSQ